MSQQSVLSVNTSLESMSESQLLAWVTDTSRVSDELAAATGRFLVVDRQIAIDPRIDSKVLDRLGASKDAICRSLAIKHPNFPIGEKMNALIKEFPEAFFENPGLNLFLIEKPSLLDGMSHVLDAVNCPDDIILWFLKRGSLADRQRIYMNEIGSFEIRKIITKDYFDRYFATKASSLSTEHDDPTIRKFFSNYCKEYRKCAFPKFITQDIDNNLHRIHDMIGGFPFTCEDYPWPETDDGHYMQPIAQINLEQASILLEEDYGSGLLQIWAPVFTSEEQKLSAKYEWSTDNYVIRIIQKRFLSNQPTTFYPEVAPWLPPYEYRNENIILLPMLRLCPDIIEKPLLIWFKASPMLKSICDEYRSEDLVFEYLCDYDEVYSTSIEDLSRDDKNNLKENLYELVMENFNTPESNIFQDNLPIVYLGGYGRSSEFYSDTNSPHFNTLRNLPALLSLAIEGDMNLTLAVNYEKWVPPHVEKTGSGEVVKFRREGKLYLEQFCNEPR